MKKRFGLKVLAFAALALVMTACNKYEEGANFSFLSAKSRVANIWKVDKITSNGVDVTSLVPIDQIEATKDGKWNVTSTVVVTVVDEGTWAFNSDKTELITTDSNGTATTATIVKLKKDEMKLSSTENGVTTVWELVTK
jgi:hypothetical protein